MKKRFFWRLNFLLETANRKKHGFFTRELAKPMKQTTKPELLDPMLHLFQKKRSSGLGANQPSSRAHSIDPISSPPSAHLPPRMALNETVSSSRMPPLVSPPPPTPSTPRVLTSVPESSTEPPPLTRAERLKTKT